MGLFSKKKKTVDYGEVILATPALHIVQLDSEEPLGINVLKGYKTGMLSFGEGANLFTMVNSRNEETGLQVDFWGYSHPFMGFKTKDLYIKCEGWIAFKIDASNSELWEKWLSHFYPQK